MRPIRKNNNIALSGRISFSIITVPRLCHWARIYYHFVANYCDKHEVVPYKHDEIVIQIYYNRHLISVI